MSYCRWSCDNWRSHVYCYEDCNGGYTIHVAVRKVVGNIPQVPPFPASGDQADCQAWMTLHRAQMAFLDTAERANIGLPVDGESFNEATLPECLTRLLWLRSLGYYVPQHAIAAIQEEITEPPSES